MGLWCCPMNYCDPHRTAWRFLLHTGALSDFFFLRDSIEKLNILLSKWRYTLRGISSHWSCIYCSNFVHSGAHTPNIRARSCLLSACKSINREQKCYQKTKHSWMDPCWLWGMKREGISKDKVKKRVHPLPLSFFLPPSSSLLSSIPSSP